MFISFHVQIVPINRKIVAQNSQFIAEKRQFVLHMLYLFLDV